MRGSKNIHIKISDKNGKFTQDQIYRLLTEIFFLQIRSCFPIKFGDKRHESCAVLVRFQIFEELPQTICNDAQKRLKNYLYFVAVQIS